MLASYQELKAWQRGVELSLEVYKLTSLFPREELYGLTSQMRRAVVSIPSNIAEGYSGRHRLEYLQFLRVAYGSSAELETQIIIVKKLGFVDVKTLERAEGLILEIKKMLSGLMKSLKENR